MNARYVELLSPAKDLACGIEAVNHGADAVYIGAPKFGARSAAGNSIADIEQLCTHAHLYRSRIYVALNTLLKDNELEEARRMAWSLYEAGVDALIVQDMALLEMDLPPIPLHASTQMDNRTVEKVRFLEQAGFSQVVLPREFTIEEIRNVAQQTHVALEVFIHGALCVSYSGQCYLSAALSGRSANRGECAQYCRLPYAMVDADGREIAQGKHLLSLRDLNQSAYLAELIDAGVTSFKIEGRLKEVSYVKNITAYYRQLLDKILEEKAIRRASDGTCRFTFTPQPEKSFNRSFTSFLLHGRQREITAFDTPKSQGEYVGQVKEMKGNSFTLAGTSVLNNGDGLSFFNARGELEGFRVNRVEANRIYPQEMPVLRPKMKLYRNFDQAFEKKLAKPSAERRIAVDITFSDHAFGFTLEMTDESGARVAIARPFQKELAQKPQTENIRTQLAKLGNTPFDPREIRIGLSLDFFVPSSLIAEMRREAVERLLSLRKINYRREVRKKTETEALYPLKKLTFLGNVLNEKAKAFYQKHGVQAIEYAYEREKNPGVPLMFTKHCLRYSFGWCPRFQKGKSPFREPYYLVWKQVKLRLDFDCKHCQMLVYKDDK